MQWQDIELEWGKTVLRMQPRHLASVVKQEIAPTLDEKTLLLSPDLSNVAFIPSK